MPQNNGSTGAKCEICPHGCVIPDGGTGLCRARVNAGGRIVPANYGIITSLALDPIEKKPLRHFLPGSMVLSAGSFGCNLDCGFCQNHTIASAVARDFTDTSYIGPNELVSQAFSLVSRGNIGIAYTYNEPLVGYEYVLDCATAAHGCGLKNVLVTNGFINAKPLRELLPFTDAMNIDLKGFTEGFYKRVRGSLPDVLRTIELAVLHCHVEVTTLIIPGENDSPDEIRALSSYLASLSPEIPLHVSRFFPKHRYSAKPPTPVGTVYVLADAAREKLRFVYTGNC